LALAEGFVVDIMGNPSQATDDGNPFLGVQQFVADVTPATVTEFAFDLDAKTIELTFSEAVDADTVQTTAIQLQSAGNASVATAASHVLTGGSVRALSLNTIRVTMLTADVQRIKAQGFGVNITTTFLAVSEGLVYDRAIGRNPSAEIPTDSGLRAANYSGDTVAPRLSRFTFDLTTQTLVLTYNEPVDVATVNFTAFVLQNNVSSPTASVTLTGGTATLVPAVEGDVASQVLTIAINAEDLTSIKSEPTLGILVDDMFLSLASGFVDDVSANAAAAVAFNSAI
jgi:hypothetical protein